MICDYVSNKKGYLTNPSNNCFYMHRISLEINPEIDERERDCKREKEEGRRRKGRVRQGQMGEKLGFGAGEELFPLHIFLNYEPHPCHRCITFKNKHIIKLPTDPILGLGPLGTLVEVPKDTCTKLATELLISMINYLTKTKIGKICLYLI